MQSSHDGTSAILVVLKDHPRGLSVKEIAEAVGMNRISVARYLDVLRTSGQVDMEPYGQAKVYFLSQRVPISAMMDFSSDYVISLDDNLHIVEANKNFLDLFGMSLKEVVGSDLLDFLSPTSGNSRLDLMIERSLSGQEVVEEICIMKGGGALWFRMKIISSVFADGSPATTLILEDITESKHYLEALIESEQNFRSIVESVNDLLFNLDSDGNLDYVSPRSLDLLGLAPAEVLGRHLTDYMDTDGAERLKEILEGTILPGEAFAFNTPVRLPSGVFLIHDVRLTAEFSEMGDFVGFHGISRDITSEKRMEEQVLAQRDLAWKLGAATSLEEALPLCVNAALDISGMDTGGIYMFDEKTGDFILISHNNASSRFLRLFSFIKHESNLGVRILDGRPIYTSYPYLPFSGDGGVPFRSEGIRSSAMIPIISQEGEVIACFAMMSRSMESVSQLSRMALETIAASLGNVVLRIRAQSLRVETEGTYRMLFQYANDPIYLYRLDGSDLPDGFVEVNEAACRHFGYVHEELLKMSVSDFSHPLHADMSVHIRSLRKGQTATLDWVHVSKSGEEIPVEINARLFRLSGEEVVISIARDLRGLSWSPAFSRS